MWDVLRSLLLVVFLAGVLLAAHAQSAAATSVFGEAEKLFSRVEKLSVEGINVSEPVRLLNSALEQAYSCTPGNSSCLSEAAATLAVAERIVGELEARAPSEIAWRNARLYATIAGIAAIPVASYLGIPRVWAWAWARSRRDWLVSRRGSRRREES